MAKNKKLCSLFLKKVKIRRKIAEFGLEIAVFLINGINLMLNKHFCLINGSTTKQ